MRAESNLILSMFEFPGEYDVLISLSRAISRNGKLSGMLIEVWVCVRFLLSDRNERSSYKDASVCLKNTIVSRSIADFKVLQKNYNYNLIKVIIFI